MSARGLVGGKGRDGGEGRALMMGSWPLIPAEMDVFLMSTTRSRLLRLPGTEKVTSASPMVCVHL